MYIYLILASTESAVSPVTFSRTRTTYFTSFAFFMASSTALGYKGYMGFKKTNDKLKNILIFYIISLPY